MGLFEASEKCPQSHAVGAITLTRVTILILNLETTWILNDMEGKSGWYTEREKLGEGTIIVQVHNFL